MKLNIGCGGDYREGWINTDIGCKDIYGRNIKIDCVLDLNKCPYEFASDFYDEIALKGSFQWVKDAENVLKELVRISKNKAKIYIEVPYFTSYTAYKELETLKFSLNCAQLFGLFRRNNLKIVKKGFYNYNNLLKPIAKIANLNEFTQNFYERFFSGIFPMNNIYWIVEVCK